MLRKPNALKSKRVMLCPKVLLNEKPILSMRGKNPSLLIAKCAIGTHQKIYENI
jgi:hypothetical protein